MIPPLSARSGHDAAVRRLGELSRDLATVQRQISTGKMVQTPGDDPIAFARIATFRRGDGADTAQRRAMDAATSRLTASETALAGIADITARAKELALAGRNATLNAGDRAVLAQEVRELLSAARGLAETKGPDGEALFAGAGVAPAYTQDADALAVWSGLGAPPLVAVSGRLLPAGISGPEAFGTTAPLPLPDPLTPPPPRPRNLFDSLTHLATSLGEARPDFFAAAMDEAIGAMDRHVANLAAAQGLIGTRAARLEAETSRLDTIGLARQTAQSKLEDTDMIAAVARLERLATVLEAAQASFARVSRLSLWDDMR